MVNGWDSFGHIQLILKLEEAFGLTIKDNQVECLTSVGKIKNFIKDRTFGEGKKEPVQKGEQIFRGLIDVNYDFTNISEIKGGEGKLYYRGYDIETLVGRLSFEETSFLILKGHIPSRKELTEYTEKLKVYRSIPKDVVDIIYKLRNSHPLEMLRTVVSFLSTVNGNRGLESTLEHGIKLISQIPIIVATFNSLRKSKDYLEPHNEYSHLQNFYYMLKGSLPTNKTLDFMERTFIIQAEHGSNASTFGARVVTSTGSDIYAAVTGAISAFSGHLHGGAAEKVVDMIKEIGDLESVSSYITNLLNKNQPIMGYGHRVYKTQDPRAKIFEEIMDKSFPYIKETKDYKILTSIADEMTKFAAHGIDKNVDFYMGLMYSVLNLPKDLLGLLFVSSRIVGWVSHVIEQKERNILIRPSLKYTDVTNMDI
nr:citrate/2-methylcitrate synthase [Cytobacillus firmus]